MTSGDVALYFFIAEAAASAALAAASLAAAAAAPAAAPAAAEAAASAAAGGGGSGRGGCATHSRCSRRRGGGFGLAAGGQRGSSHQGCQQERFIHACPQSKGVETVSGMVSPARDAVPARASVPRTQHRALWCPTDDCIRGGPESLESQHGHRPGRLAAMTRARRCARAARSNRVVRSSSGPARARGQAAPGSRRRTTTPRACPRGRDRLGSCTARHARTACATRRIAAARAR